MLFTREHIPGKMEKRFEELLGVQQLSLDCAARPKLWFFSFSSAPTLPFKRGRHGVEHQRLLVRS